MLSLLYIRVDPPPTAAGVFPGGAHRPGTTGTTRTTRTASAGTTATTRTTATAGTAGTAAKGLIANGG